MRTREDLGVTRFTNPVSVTQCANRATTRVAPTAGDAGGCRSLLRLEPAQWFAASEISWRPPLRSRRLLMKSSGYIHVAAAGVRNPMEPAMSPRKAVQL